MKTLSIHSSEKEVEQKIISYLSSRNYRQIKVDAAAREITCKRTNAFLMTDKCRFKLKTTGEAVTHVDISVNPEKKKASTKDAAMEAFLQERIYLYF